MTGDELLVILAERGLSVVAKPTGLALRGKTKHVTPRLRRVLALHKAWLLQKFPLPKQESEPVPEAVTPAVQPPEGVRRKPQIECRWRWGHIFPHHFPEQGWPTGAGWFRYVGEGDEQWQPIPGREMARGEVPCDLPQASAKSVSVLPNPKLSAIAAGL